jgi:ribulose-5-phosphate 4-epimerase/fuculose-1-phosphate aldolase
LPEVNAIFHSHDIAIMKTGYKLGIPSTETEQAGGSPELAQEAVNLVKLNKATRCFVLKNHGVITLGATMSEAGKLMEEMHTKAMGSVKNPVTKKKKTG